MFDPESLASIWLKEYSSVSKIKQSKRFIIEHYGLTNEQYINVVDNVRTLIGKRVMKYNQDNLTNILQIVKAGKLNDIDRILNLVGLQKDQLTEIFVEKFHKLKDVKGDCLDKQCVRVGTQIVGYRIVPKERWSIYDIILAVQNYYLYKFENKKFTKIDTERIFIYKQYRDDYEKSLTSIKSSKRFESAYMLMLKQEINEKRNKISCCENVECLEIKKPKKSLSKKEKAARRTAKMRQEYNEKHKFIDPPQITTYKSVWAVKKR